VVHPPPRRLRLTQMLLPPCLLLRRLQLVTLLPLRPHRRSLPPHRPQPVYRT